MRSRAKSAIEQDFHITAAQYLDIALPAHCVWTTFPAGGGGKRRGQFLKAMGLKPGWPDIQILVRESPFDTIRPMSRFIGLECKRLRGGIVSKTQAAAHWGIRNAGGEVYVVRTIEEIYDFLTNKELLRLKAKPLMATQSPALKIVGSTNKDRKNA